MAELDRFGAGGIVRGARFFGDFAKTFSVPIEVAAASLIADDGEAFAEGRGQLGKSLKLAGVSRKRPL